MEKIEFLENDFQLASQDFSQEDASHLAANSFWKDAWKRFTDNKGAVVALWVIVIIIAIAIIAPMLSSYKYDEVFTNKQSLPPRIPGLEKIGIFTGISNGVNKYESLNILNEYHYFGTDVLGRDLWVRVWSGTQISLQIAFIAVLIDICFGMVYGLISGYFGGKVDTIMQRFVEIVNSIPSLVILVLLLVVMSPSLTTIIIALMLTGWIGMSRVTRAQVLKVKEQEFILASKTLGSSHLYIIFKDILPNIFGQIIIMSMFSIPSAIFYEAFLAFVGLGLPVPMASLGTLINTGFKSILVSPFMTIIPVVVLAILMLSFNLLADGLRDAFDPKMKDM
ncbi:oligopeptide ABC transporter permease [Erysipelothrix urinaevulpis]|uniref:oligopeptide ABC transporter permease n=1 Tax=Erysipelothrix urinaevulpis TaxID=2683717 RepID=UPI001356F835|nr:oligopeptide ABC transporter permease [Erysipelothrix urinaevulpis]